MMQLAAAPLPVVRELLHLLATMQRLMAATGGAHHSGGGAGSVLLATWSLHFQPLARDLAIVLAPRQHHSEPETASSSGLTASTAAAASVLVVLLEFLALHQAWATIAWLLASSPDLLPHANQAAQQRPEQPLARRILRLSCRQAAAAHMCSAGVCRKRRRASPPSSSSLLPLRLRTDVKRLCGSNRLTDDLPGPADASSSTTACCTTGSSSSSSTACHLSSGACAARMSAGALGSSNSSSNCTVRLAALAKSWDAAAACVMLAFLPAVLLLFIALHEPACILTSPYGVCSRSCCMHDVVGTAVPLPLPPQPPLHLALVLSLALAVIGACLAARRVCLVL